MVSDPIYLYKLLETKNARLQAFFWYRHTWLILSVLTLMLDTNILTSEGSQPAFFSCAFMAKIA